MSRHMIEEVNFLQQTSLHMAVDQPLLLKSLIDFLDDPSAINAKDLWGFTPLMYAAASGYTESVVMLISKGAHPFARDRQGRTFLSLAIDRNHWKLLMAGINATRLDYNHKIYQVLVRHALVQSITPPFHRVGKEVRTNYVVQLILQCDNVNFQIDSSHEGVTDETLMVYAHTIEEARALVGQGFPAFNTTNSQGQLPIHSHRYNVELLKFCLDHGTDVNHVDNNGDTLLLTLLSTLSVTDHRKPNLLEAIRICMEHGADSSLSDKCKCPCSPDGCSSSSVFSHAFKTSVDSFLESRVAWVWGFEWASTLEEYHGKQAAHDLLCSLIRRIKFDQLGMTHVCCHGGRSKPVLNDPYLARKPRPLEEADVNDIIEEESEFIQILDEEMEELSCLSLEELRKVYMQLLYEGYSEYEANVKRILAEERSDISVSPEHSERPVSDMPLKALLVQQSQSNSQQLTVHRLRSRRYHRSNLYYRLAQGILVPNCGIFGDVYWMPRVPYVKGSSLRGGHAHNWIPLVLQQTAMDC